jgi:hypothetical protein
MLCFTENNMANLFDLKAQDGNPFPVVQRIKFPINVDEYKKKNEKVHKKPKDVDRTEGYNTNADVSQIT